MVPKKDENDSSSKETLSIILSTVMALKNQINTLDLRISKLEGHIDQRLPAIVRSSTVKVETVNKNDFNSLDEHLKRTYQILAHSTKPMTASEVAERMGRSRSTTSYHLNKLFNLDFLEKVPGTSKDSSRNVFFRPKDRIFEEVESRK